MSWDMEYWNIGIREYWKKKRLSLLSFLHITISPFLRSNIPAIHYSTIPTFQFSKVVL